MFRIGTTGTQRSRGNVTKLGITWRSVRFRLEVHQDVSPWRFTIAASVDGVGISHQRLREFSGNMDFCYFPAGQSETQNFEVVQL